MAQQVNTTYGTSFYNFGSHFNGGINVSTRGRGLERGGHGRGRTGVQGQVCLKHGHDASICYHRFDQYFTQQPPSLQQQY